MADTLDDDDAATLSRLEARLRRDTAGYALTERGPRRRLGFKALDAYYDGEQRLHQLGIAVPDQLREFITIVAWPGTYVDAVTEREQVTGFQLPGQSQTDDRLWGWWTFNQLDDESGMARTDKRVFGRGYYCLGSNSDDLETPLITVESPLEMTHEWSNRQRAVTAAARFYEDDTGGARTRHATYYTPDATRWLVKGPNGWEFDEDPDEHKIGRTPVVPLVARARSHNRYGLSSMGRIISLTDAAARALTNAQIATELLSVPQRWAAGMTAADFKDPKTGEALTAWEAYFGAVWAAQNAETKFGQFPAADLGNFTKIVSHYAQLCSGVTGLPMRYYGQLSDNPPSADGIRADENRLIKACERDNLSEAEALEQVMQIGDRIVTGDWDPNLRKLGTLHRDPSTPTIAEQADATVKLFGAGIIPKRQARRDLGYTPPQIEQMELDDESEANDPLLATVAKGLIGVGAGASGGS